jgi:hypothetical protein
VAWIASTATETIFGSSSMASASSLNRAVVAIPTNQTITAFEFNLWISPGAGSGTYNSFPTGTFGNLPHWLVGIAYVLTGGTVPAVGTAADDPAVLWAGWTEPYFDRNTIQNGASPAYQDLYIYGLKTKGRLQLPSGIGGNIYMLLNNTGTATVPTQWEATIRASYDPV